MNTTKVIAALTGLVTPWVVFADTTLFGKMNASYGFVNDNGKTEQNIRGVGSVLGVRGFSPLENGMDVTYIIEAGLDMDKTSVTNSTRQAWLGVRTDFGEFRAGRQFAASKVATAAVDMFSDQYGDYNAVMETDLTYKHSISYINKYGPIGFALEVATDKEISPRSSTLAVTDFVVNYSGAYGQDRFYSAVAMLSAKDNLKLARLSGVYTFFDGHKVGAAFEDTRLKAGGGHSATVHSGGYQATPLLMLKTQYGLNKKKAGGKNETLLAVGLDYTLGKKTTLTLEHSINKNRLHVAGDEQKVTALGISHQF